MHLEGIQLVDIKIKLSMQHLFQFRTYQKACLGPLREPKIEL